MKFGKKLGVTIFVISAGSVAAAADMDSASPFKAASEKQVTAYDLSTTYGSDTVRIVLTQSAGASQYSTLVNNKLVASATVEKDSSAASFASYIESSAKAISGVGANPAQFGFSTLTPVSFVERPEFDQAKFKKEMEGKGADQMLSKQLTGTLSD